VANPESVLLAQILLALGSRPDCRVFRNNVGKLPDPRSGRWVTFGLAPGAPDIVCVLRGGRFMGIEVKTPTGRLRPEQEAFRDMLLNLGADYVVVRSVEDAVQAVEGART
jgi:hypothetical protein